MIFVSKYSRMTILYEEVFAGVVDITEPVTLASMTYAELFGPLGLIFGLVMRERAKRTYSEMQVRSVSGSVLNSSFLSFSCSRRLEKRTECCSRLLFSQVIFSILTSCSQALSLQLVAPFFLALGTTIYICNQNFDLHIEEVEHATAAVRNPLLTLTLFLAGLLHFRYRVSNHQSLRHQALPQVVFFG